MTFNLHLTFLALGLSLVLTPSRGSPPFSFQKSASLLLPEICSQRLLQDSVVPIMEGLPGCPVTPIPKAFRWHVPVQRASERRVVCERVGAWGGTGSEVGGRLANLLRERNCGYRMGLREGKRGLEGEVSTRGNRDFVR